MIEDTSSGSFDYGITPFGRAASLKMTGQKVMVFSLKKIT
jgi:hypothetical protein